MENNKITISMEQQFGEVINIILQHKSRVSKAVNEELLLTAWHVDGYVSAKLDAAVFTHATVLYSMPIRSI